MRLLLNSTMFAGLSLALAMPAQAQEAAQPGIDFELGVAGQWKPAYEGASSYILSPVPLFKLNRLTFSNGTQIGGKKGEGFSIAPAFNIVGSREADDHKDLKGLNDIDTAIEGGLKLRYRNEGFRAYGEVRRGFGGHEGYVGEAGLDLITNPDPQLQLYAGPRVFYADEEYMRTYFGVTRREAARSPLASYRPGSGIKSYGLEAGARLDVDDNWAMIGRVNYERFTGDAADSPIVKSGSADQFSARIGIVRKFRLNF